MRTEKLKATIHLDEKDYFYVERWEGGYRLTICEGRGMPMHFTGLTDRQLLGLGSQVQKAFVAAQEERMKSLFADKEAKAEGTGFTGDSRPAPCTPIVSGFVC